MVDKTDEYLTNRRNQIRNADYSEETKDAILTFLDAYNPDNFHLKPPILKNADQREDTLSTSSRLAYASTLHRTAKSLDLTECTTSQLNRHATNRLNGTHESVDDDGVSENTVHQNQVAWRSFARFHNVHRDGSDINIDPDEIHLIERSDSHVDERDMFNSEEIEAMRTACRNKRDRALLELLIFTGQRHNALRQLKFNDIQPHEGESGVMYMPDIDEGLKGAKGKRPLLAAKQACKEWKRNHPTQEDDDAFFTHIYNWGGHDNIEQGDHLSRQAFGNITKRIAERAGVDKPANPHQFRHFFVTKSISKHNMSMDTVRHLIGHAADSRELERTYQHLVDEDHIENAEIDMELRDDREETLAPATCPQCSRAVEQSWSICPRCEFILTPDAQEVSKEINRRSTQGAIRVEDDDKRDIVRTFVDMIDDPDKLDAFAQAINNEKGSQPSGD
jgi:integrase/recombinase XerD